MKNLLINDTHTQDSQAAVTPELALQLLKEGISDF